ncbi:MAG: CPBP family intramembrane metalloprotease [Thermanaerothrix sp.]|nr:CPBP family intramembrane metalloprotease [Thermanaerothrix sp.]
MLKRHPLLGFYLLAFGLAWLGWLPQVWSVRDIAPFNQPYWQGLLILPGIAPALAALLITGTTEGGSGVRRLFQPLLRWRVGWPWYGAVVAGPWGLLLLAKGVTTLLGLPGLPSGSPHEDTSLIVTAFLTSLLANPWEEVGWRGFALPRWQKRYSALTASLILGSLWGLWHLPLFFWVGNPMTTYPFGLWFLSLLALTVLYTWLYNTTAGNLFVVALFHVSLNTFGTIVQGISLLSLVVIYGLVALILLICFGPTHLSPQPRIQAG